MEDTKDLEIDIDDIGTILKSSRLKQKKSLEDISSELCIRKIYLAALEEGNYETLPPIPYGVGYVRTYAHFLGLNPERAVKLYKAAAEIENDGTEDVVETNSDANKSNSWHIVIGILALMIVYGSWNLYALKTAPKPMEEAPEEIVSVSQAVTSENAINEDVAISDSENAEVVTKDETENENQEVISSVDKTEESAVTNEAEESQEKPAVVDNNVVLEFTGETWVELKDKKKVYFQGVFHQGDKKELEYSDNLFLSVGRPHNLNLFIKGEKKDVAAARKKMNIPLDSLN